MRASTREMYERDGFVVLRTVLRRSVVLELSAQLESAIDAMADELQVTRARYLDSVCRWSTPIAAVEHLVRVVAPALRATVAAVLCSAKVQPSRASVFRKSQAAAVGTHGHQDAGYWVRPTSSRYALTTWVALDDVDEGSGALRVLPESHHGRVGAPVDYLAPGFRDPAEAWGSAARSLPIHAGDAVIFHPRLWHASHGSGGRVRRALAIRWGVPETAPRTDTTSPTGGGFGMYTSGRYLAAALRRLAGGQTVGDGAARVRWALDHDLASHLSAPVDARRALERLLLYMEAGALHSATDQRGMVWEPVRDLVVAPTVGLATLA